MIDGLSIDCKRRCFSLATLHDLQGTFSFDDFFKSIVADVLPSLDDDESRLSDGNQSFGNGSLEDGGGKGNAVLIGQPFPEAAVLLPLCRDARSELVDLCYKVRSHSKCPVEFPVS